MFNSNQTKELSEMEKELLSALKDLVQIIEWQGDSQFLNEDADDGNENPLSVAREVIAKAEGN